LCEVHENSLSLDVRKRASAPSVRSSLSGRDNP
jgi:hypothetical protein